MSGIPVYTAAPINAGVTPKTAAPENQPISLAPTTTAAAPTSSYPPARPGAAAPAPTGTASQRYAPTPTTTAAPQYPPAPQPGAVPTAHKSAITPPPKAGEKYQYRALTTTSAPVAQPQPYPPQMGLPPPTGGMAPSGTATTSNYPSTSYPAPITSSEHPPGYTQNTYASEMSSDQRRAQDAQNASSQHRAGDLGTDEGGLWETAKKWGMQAGESLAKAEAEVWRMVNKE